MTGNSQDSLICVGRIASAHGIRGQVNIKSYTEDSNNIRSYNIVNKNGSPLVLSFIGAKNSMLIAAIDGINDRTKAEKLIGTELFIDRNVLPELAEGEFYHHDLIDLIVHDKDNKKIGLVNALYNFGAGEIIEITFDDGRLEMFPFNERTVPDINISDGYIILDIPKEVLCSK